MSLKVVISCVAIFFVIQLATFAYGRPEGASTPAPTNEENIKKMYEKAVEDFQTAFANIQKSPLAQNLSKIFNDLGDTIQQQAAQLQTNLNAKPAPEN